MTERDAQAEMRQRLASIPRKGGGGIFGLIRKDKEEESMSTKLPKKTNKRLEKRGKGMRVGPQKRYYRKD